MRKLLVMASLFPPQKNGGGPPVSIMNVVQAIKDEFEIYVISKHYELGQKEPLPDVDAGWNSFAFGKVYYFPCGQYTYSNVYRLIEEIAPDVIYQNSFFSHDDVLPVLYYKKKHPQVGVVVAPRGEICQNRFSKGKLKKSAYITVLKTLGMMKGVYFQATGDDEKKDMVRYLKIKPERIYNINNFSIADPAQQTAVEKQPGSLRLCFIARIQDTKNLYYGVQQLQQLTGDITYDIYGPMENPGYFDKCLAVPLPENVKLNYCGSVDHADVGRTISRYHAYYMPTIGENYGHSIVESLLYRRPVVISDKTPWNGVNQAGAGWAIPLDEPEAFQAALQTLADMDAPEFSTMCDAAQRFIHDRLQVDGIVAQYIDCFNEI